MKRSIVFLALACAPMARADAIDDYLRAQMRQLHVPGMTVAVVRDGRVVKTGGYGLANDRLHIRSAKLRHDGLSE